MRCAVEDELAALIVKISAAFREEDPVGLARVHIR
jgi:hypothetical protein